MTKNYRKHLSSAFLALSLMWSFVFLRFYINFNDNYKSSRVEQLQHRADKVIYFHSHNDYEKSRPLFGAIALGFKSLEVDVYAFGDQLYVAHYLWQINRHKNLNTLYIEPLIVAANNNALNQYTSEDPLLIFVDFKNNPNKALRLLARAITNLHSNISQSDMARIKFVLTGQLPDQNSLNDIKFPLSIDGRIRHIETQINSGVHLVLSADWDEYFANDWPLSQASSAKIKRFVSLANQHNKLLRFWNAPDDEQSWRYLKKYGIKLINTDKVDEMHARVVPTGEY